ncbi:MAG TPA: cupin domain-containing protein [Pyrinomonadaceae bacterium]|jgi:ribosomal protein L16 Arg81 hydroxylase
MSSAKLDFESLIAPISPQEFFAHYWETQPLVVSRGEPLHYASLMSFADLDDLVADACRLQNSSVELLGDASITGTPYAARVERASDVQEAYGRGATVRINNVQQLSKPLGTLCHRLEQVFSFPLRANLYSTPATAQGAQRHYDNHDILVLQISGRKRWLISEPLVALPLEHVPPLSFERRTEELKYRRGGPTRGRGDIGDDVARTPLRDIVLEAGDLLYLPRGFVHEAKTSTEASLHVTLGIHVLTWLDLLSVALGQMSNRDERFRRALPVGFANESGAERDCREQFETLLQAFAQHADLKNAFDETAASFIRSREPRTYDPTAATDNDLTAKTGDATLAQDASNVADNAGSMEDVARSINLDTMLERTPGLLCRVVLEGSMAGLASAQGILWMPATFADALRFVARTIEFRVSEIPGVSDSGKLALVRRLLHDGFLRVAREA